ncbi:DUF6481 family protein [Govanella unica]|uniref:DUF6481 family protein n=1 Tax=Govanella unica TaxID=2975056 RepID=A0A9X3Z6F4_9PROT|nr:DUF6481 family protein [Govania unica]MDA5192874.1 DUF6481 family protein [Govania unica]
MTSYKDPSFQERAALAQQARLKAVALLRAKPPVDEATLAAQSAARLVREKAEAEARLAKLAAREQAKADKLAQKLARAASAGTTSGAPVLSEAEKKLARDARYVSRKNRQAAK